MNHYATKMFLDEGGRHHWFAKYLKKEGYNPTIFCANTIHNSDEIIEFNGLYKKDISEDIKYIFVKTTKTISNGLDRVKNMITFYLNVKRTARKIIEVEGKPDVILASSVHPLTLVAGIQIGKKYNIPVICEVRDLWPESFVAYGILKKTHPLTRILYAGERWIYSKSDTLIFTMQGGKDYVVEKGWASSKKASIPTDKIYHINNGVDLDSFNINKLSYQINDKDLLDETTFKIIYTGSIRKANNILKLVETAKALKDDTRFKFLIYGDGSHKSYLEDYCKVNKITNVVFKGKVEKKYVPFILSNSNLNIFQFQRNDIGRYGASLNKMFEYFASGVPTLVDYRFGFDLIEKNNVGIIVESDDVEVLSKSILKISNTDDHYYNVMCENAKNLAINYDYKKLTKNLIEIIEGASK